MSSQPPANATRIVSANVLPLAEGFNEAIVENKKEVLEPFVGFGGKIRRTHFGTQTFPPTNAGPVPVVSDLIVLPGGTNVFFLDIAPGHETPMHRTVSTDYILAQSGTPTLVTPKGAFNIVDGKADYTETEEVLMNEGELLVQRGQFHAWKNHTDSWVRLLCFIVHAEDLKVEVGKEKETKSLGEVWL